jgi:Xaa-Pro dipeptidase
MTTDGLTEARLGRLRAELAAAPFDAVVLTAPEDVQYATGYRSVAGQLHRSHPMAALVSGDRVVLVAPASEAAPAVDAGIAADDIVPFGRFYFAGPGPAAAMSDRNADFAAALKKAYGLLGRGRVAVAGDLPADIGEDDATAWMLGVRAVKLPGEQELLREAARLAERGIEAALARAAAGVTERELAAEVATAMAADGGTPRFTVVTAGERSALGDAFAADRPLASGDLLRFDVGCVYEGYWSDIARTAVVGEPTARQQAYYDALLAGVQAEFAAARPGATAGAVFDAAVAEVERTGGPTPYRRHHAGHAIGLSVYEHPIVGPGRDTELVPGMVFCLETPYYELGWGGMMVEDTGVVTGEGFELFTSIDRSLRVVPA